jgi:hypothetical protein
MEHQAKLQLPIKTKQLNIRMDEALLLRFKNKVDELRVNQTEVCEMLLIIWLEHAEDHSVRHLDGTECPMSAMIKALAQATRAQLMDPTKLRKEKP